RGVVWSPVGEPDGGKVRPFDTLFTKFAPALKAAGVSEASVRQLLVDNPRRALTGQKKGDRDHESACSSGVGDPAGVPRVLMKPLWPELAARSDHTSLELSLRP